VTGDWLDRAATVAEERLSRRRLVAASFGLFALGPLGALMRAAPVAAAAPCQAPCLQRWSEDFAASGKPWLELAVFSVATANPIWVAGSLGTGVAGLYYFEGEVGKCYQPNCGGPHPPPPPPSSPPPPPPPPPAQHGEPEHPPSTKSKGPAKRKRKKPPAKKDPSKNSICVDLGCAAVGAACCPTSQGSFGYVCCNCCADSGDGCKAICG
jgi:hypothetical protein